MLILAAALHEGDVMSMGATGRITYAAELIGICQKTAYNWCEEFSEVRKAYPHRAGRQLERHLPAADRVGN